MTRSAIPSNSTVGRPRNPYIGPKAFAPDMVLPGRDRESQELCQTMVAERIVLLHAPSGAGKSSLLQAGITVPLRLRGFTPTRPIRVNEPIDPAVPVANRYVYSVAVKLLAGRSDIEPVRLRTMSLAEVADLALPRGKDAGRPVLVLDQFEEVLNLNPTDWDAKEEFFEQLGTLLDDSGIWAVLSMREDYMGGLQRYATLLPGHLQARYRLEFLSKDAAREAITQPAAAQGVTVAEDAVDALVDKLMKVCVERPGGPVEILDAPFVEPVQLQVVCRRLWQSIRTARPVFSTISRDEVETLVDVKTALGSYYGRGVHKVATDAKIDEGALREWFERQLITEQGFRGQTNNLPRAAGADPSSIARELEDAYLIRGDVRANTTWYELAHDRLIEPVMASNEIWRNENLPWWRSRAYEWERARNPNLLMSGAEVRHARRELGESATDVERDFLVESEKHLKDETLLRRARALAGSWLAVAALELVVIVVLILLLLRS